jgi:hypothetical protein
MPYQPGDLVTAVQTTGAWSVHDVRGGPTGGEVCRLHRRGWHDLEGHDAGEAELADADIDVPTYAVGAAVSLFGRPARVTAIVGGQYVVEVRKPRELAAGPDVHVYRLPAWRLHRGY